MGTASLKGVQKFRFQFCRTAAVVLSCQPITSELLYREESLRQVSKRKGVLLTTYGMVLHNAAALALQQQRRSDNADDRCWDFMILDEVSYSQLALSCLYTALEHPAQGVCQRCLLMG